MIMAAEFESLWHPFLIMVTVPFSVVGVAFSLFVTQTPVSAPVFLGIILLVGERGQLRNYFDRLYYELRREGRPLRGAVVDGCTNCLRPVLMSVCFDHDFSCLAFGVRPERGGAFFAHGGGDVRGLGISVLLSLFVLPLIYFHSESWRERRAVARAAETPLDPPSSER